MPTGKVKWFSDAKGYGFLVCERTGKDVFIHFSAIEGAGYRSLNEGETVEYEVESGDKGLKATWVRRVEQAAPSA